ncbi:MAG TPA: hypothetical protein VMN04_01370, partial [Thermoanaerobaculia bacterium]|nr:hypothetical protein [Thermoanaerobaculia bacterium]
MIVLHGSPLPSGFAFWAEGATVARAARDAHPRAVAAEELEAALREEGLAGFLPSARARVAALALAAPAVQGRPVPSVPALREPADYAAAGSPTLRTFLLPGLVFAPVDALEALLGLPGLLRLRPLSLTAGDDFEYWAEVARWTYDLLLRRRVAPTADADRPRWRPVLTDPHEKERFRRFASALPPVSRALSEEGAAPPSDGGLPPAAAVLHGFLDAAVDAAARDVLREVLPAERRRAGDGPEALAIAGLAETPAPPADAAVLARLAEWSLPVLDPLPEGSLRLGIRVVPPETVGGAFALRYALESTEKDEITLTAEEIGESPETAVRRRGRLFSN